MKSKAMWVFRHLFIPLGFMWATGIVSGVRSTYKTSNTSSFSDAAESFSKSELAAIEMRPATLGQYCDSLFQARKRYLESTGKYEPYLYFHDLKQFKMFTALYGDSLNKTAEGRIIFLRYLSPCGGSAMSMFISLRDETWHGQKEFSSKENKLLAMDLDAARDHWFPAEAARSLASEKGPPISFYKDMACPVFAWLFRVYLRGLPFAFLLFLLWRVRLKKEYEEETRYSKIKAPFKGFGFSPLSFLFSLLAWPVILWADIKNRMNQLQNRAEMLSRRNNMLSILAIGDEKLLELGRTMSLREFRKHLDQIGRVRRHSFAMALVVTIFVSACPSVSFAASPVSEVCHLSASFEAHRSADCDVGKTKCMHENSYYIQAMMPVESPDDPVCKKKNLYFSRKVWRTLSGFLPHSDGVPKARINFA